MQRLQLINRSRIYLASVMVMRLMLLLLRVQYDGQPVDDGHHHSPIAAFAALPRLDLVIVMLLVFISSSRRGSPRIRRSSPVAFSQKQLQDLSFDALMILVVFGLASLPFRVTFSAVVIRTLRVVLMIMVTRVLIRRVLISHRSVCLGRRQAFDSVGCVYLVAADTGHLVHCSTLCAATFSVPHLIQDVGDDRHSRLMMT